MNVIVLDNKNLEHKLTLDKQYEVKGESTGDFYDYYLLLCDDGSKHWVEKYRVAESRSREILGEIGLLATEIPVELSPVKYEIKTPFPLPYVKPPIENIVEIPFPSDTSHGIDLYRVQYISPLDGGSYELTMGWMEKVKLTEKIYPRAKIMAQWKAVRNK